MSYNLNVQGHVEGASAGEGAAKEQTIIDKAKALVAELEGVVAASGSFLHHGAVPLHEPTPVTEPPATAPEPPAASG